MEVNGRLLEEVAFVLGILRVIGRGFLGGPVVETPLSKGTWV